MKPEQKLLVALLTETDLNAIESSLPNNLDWQSFLQTAAKHRLIPLVFEKLRLVRAELPPHIFDNLQRRAENCQVSNLTLGSQLVKVARIFEENAIEFLIYKGAPLAQLAYNNLSRRQFGDLDVLIRKKDFPAVKKNLLAAGAKPAWTLTVKQEKAVVRHHYEFPFEIGDDPVLVEVHWALTESFFGFDYPANDVFRRSQPITIYGKRIRTLSNEDLLLFLCVHGSKHFWKRLSWICDVGRLVENQLINWDSVSELAADYGCRRMLYLGLKLAKDFTKIELPVEIERQIKTDKEIKDLAAELKKNLFDDDFSPDIPRPHLHLKMRERWRDKFTYSQRLFRTKIVDSLFMPMGRPR